MWYVMSHRLISVIIVITHENFNQSDCRKNFKKCCIWNPIWKLKKLIFSAKYQRSLVRIRRVTIDRNFLWSPFHLDQQKGICVISVMSLTLFSLLIMSSRETEQNVWTECVIFWIYDLCINKCRHNLIFHYVLFSVIKNNFQCKMFTYFQNFEFFNLFVNFVSL